jgi:DNA (cytosine-5)-methyltransferase 1
MHRTLDCFCGAGGFTTGLVWAGMDVRMGLDIDEHALAVYRANHPTHAAVALDLSETERAARVIREGVGETVEVLAGSPPCTDFSSAGSRTERASVAGLTVNFARLAAMLRPRLLVLENVPELLRSQAWSDACEVLVHAGYAVTVLRLNAAACAVPQVRRRVFVLATLNCEPSMLRSIESEATGMNRTPPDAPKVSDCLDAPADCYFYCSRNRHSPCIRSTDLPSPTLRCNCLAAPPPQYQPRHDDAGSVADARVLSVSEMARVASFPPCYFDCTSSRVAAGRMLGNCVPPRMAEVVGRWIVQLLRRPPVTSVDRPIHTVARRRQACRISRVHRLVDLGLLDAGARLADDGSLVYVGGSSAKGDGIVLRVLRWTPARDWRVVLKPRRNASASAGQAPLDDLYVHVTGIDQPIRSIRQLLRSMPQQHPV